METETVSSLNIVDLLFRERFGTDICGVKVKATSPPTPSPAPEAVTDQAVLGKDSEEAIEHPKTTQTTRQPLEKIEKVDNRKSVDFIRGWDC